MNHEYQIQDVYLTNKIEYDVNIYNYVHIFSLHALLDNIIIMCNNIRNKMYIIQFQDLLYVM